MKLISICLGFYQTNKQKTYDLNQMIQINNPKFNHYQRIFFLFYFHIHYLVFLEYKIILIIAMLKKFLASIDLFSYVPVPQAYPISTNKSKAGSLFVICLLLAYFIYDLYRFFVANVPTINSSQENTINNGNFSVPNISFGMVYSSPASSSLRQLYVINDPNYFYFKFYAVLTTTFPNGSFTRSLNELALVNCDQISPLWAGKWYQNLTCLNLNSQIIDSLNIGYPVINSENELVVSNWIDSSNTSYVYSFRLYVYMCSNTTTSSTCAEPAKITYFLQNSKFYFIGYQPQGYNYKTSTSIKMITLGYSTVLSSTSSQSQTFWVTPTRFINFPNFISSFTNRLTDFSQITYQYLSTYNYPLSYMLRVSLQLSPSFLQVDIHPQSFIDRLSQWSALASLVFMIGTLCLLTYNRKKYEKINPQWNQFDKMLRDKLNIEMQVIEPKEKKKKKKVDDQIQLRLNNLMASNNQDPNIGQGGMNENSNKVQSYLDSQANNIREEMIDQSQRNVIDDEQKQN